MLKKRKIRVLVSILIPFLVAAYTGQANGMVVASSTFDSDLEGWTPEPGTAPSVFTHQAVGGNPDGYVRLDNNQPGVINGRLYAPAEFLGNWLALGVTRLTYDAAIFQTGGFVGPPIPYRIFISGPGGDATFFGPNPGSTPAPDWVGIEALLNESAWTVNSGTWEALLGNVTELQIGMAYYTNTSPAEITGLDNVMLYGAAVSAPEPATFAIIGLGLAGIGFTRRKRTN